ncbi:unnamed protein product [Nezara viridula]|uniref:Uncharacterized protein n=1 Tax=Nezara viridula TaxID=85310 RepID=A0A9P0EB43_NEZVI|nr:unnamed protein product [Nezara viridula]
MAVDEAAAKKLWVREPGLRKPSIKTSIDGGFGVAVVIQRLAKETAFILQLSLFPPQSIFATSVFVQIDLFKTEDQLSDSAVRSAALLGQRPDTYAQPTSYNGTGKPS